MRTLGGAGATLLAALVFSGCVYFNTFYNARKYYGEGEKLAAREPEGAPLPPPARTAFEKSVEKSSSVLASHPDSKYADDALLLLGKAHYWLGNYPQAATALRALVENHPQSGLRREAAMWLVRAGREGGDVATAERLADEMLADGSLSASERADLQLERARLAMQAGERARAVEIYESVSREDEALARSRGVPLLLVEARLAQGDTARALDELQPMVASGVDPEAQRRAAVLMAQVLATAGERDRAVRTYEEILAGGVADSLAADIHLALSESKHASGDVRAAAEELSAAARLVPSTPVAASALYRRGLLEWREIHDRGAAKETFLEAFLQSPDAPVADSAAEAARAVQEIQHYQAILSGSERVLSPLPAEEVQATATYLLAELLYTREADREGARELFADMLDRYPRSAWIPKVLYTLGWLAEEEARAEEARAAGANNGIAPLPESATAFYSRVMAEHPATEYARFARERLADARVEGVAAELAAVAEPSTGAPSVPAAVSAPTVAGPEPASAGEPTPTSAAEPAPGLLPLPDPERVVQIDAGTRSAAPVGDTLTGAAPVGDTPALRAVPGDTLTGVPPGEAPAPGVVPGDGPIGVERPGEVSPPGATAVDTSTGAAPPGQAAAPVAPAGTGEGGATALPSERVDEKLLAFTRAIPRAPDPLLGIQDRLLARRSEESAEDRAVRRTTGEGAVGRAAGQDSAAAGDSLSREEIEERIRSGEDALAPPDTAPEPFLPPAEDAPEAVGPDAGDVEQ